MCTTAWSFDAASWRSYPPRGPGFEVQLKIGWTPLCTAMWPAFRLFGVWKVFSLYGFGKVEVGYLHSKFARCV